MDEQNKDIVVAKRTYILMGVLVLLAGALLASAVLAQEPDSPPTAEEGETYPEEAVRDQLDEDGKIVTTDDRLAKVAKDHSGGFGGYYFDKTVEGQVFVFMTDPSQTNAARDAFQAAYKGNRTVTQITPIKGEYAFDDLLTWFRTLDRVMLADGIYPSAGAAREIQNRIWFALEDIGQVDTILELMRSLEIPEGAVMFEEAHSELLSGEDDVQSKWRPLVGGVKFQIKFGQPYCTVGFMTERGGVNGLVTASHCNNDDDDHPNGGIGGNEDANIFQPISITTTHLGWDARHWPIPFVNVHRATVSAALAPRSFPEAEHQPVVVILDTCSSTTRSLRQRLIQA